jgi:hypothetical protein
MSTVETKVTHECVLELLKLSSNVNECKPLVTGTPHDGAGRVQHCLDVFRERVSFVVSNAVPQAGAYTRPRGVNSDFRGVLVGY